MPHRDPTAKTDARLAVDRLLNPLGSGPQFRAAIAARLAVLMSDPEVAARVRGNLDRRIVDAAHRKPLPLWLRAERSGTESMNGPAVCASSDPTLRSACI